MNQPVPENQTPEMSTVAQVIAEALQPVSMNPERGLQLQSAVLDRVRRSVAAHRDLTTVRREDGAWMATGPGVRQRSLHDAGGMRVQLLQLDPHASMPWVQGAHAEEVLVVDGGLVANADGASFPLPRFHQLVIGRDSGPLLRAGIDGASLYLRCRLVELDQLPEAEARWWVQAQKVSVLKAAQPRIWSSFLEGVDALDLQTHGGVASMLLRIAPGVMLPDHGHGLNEDCFMLDGDMFLGDVLMRAGDYQLALAGGRHVGISSDEGGLFYFHGALPDPASELAP